MTGPRWVDVDGARVAVVEAGEPSGPPAVLLPGLTDGLAPVWSPEARALLGAVPAPMHRYRGLVLSYRDPVDQAPATDGSTATEGATATDGGTATGGATSTRQLADDTAAVLRRVLDAPALVVTHSMGGMVAQHLAADHPELVGGLVLSATLPRADDAFRAVLARWGALLVDGRWRAFHDDAVRRSYTGTARVRRRARLHLGRVRPPTPHRVARHLALSRVAAHHDALDRLAGIRAPTLVLAGERDTVAPPAHAGILAARLPDARLRVFGRVAHGFPEQLAGPFRSAVVAFAEEVVT